MVLQQLVFLVLGIPEKLEAAQGFDSAIPRQETQGRQLWETEFLLVARAEPFCNKFLEHVFSN
jgi:hypothetical protein